MRAGSCRQSLNSLQLLRVCAQLQNLNLNSLQLLRVCAQLQNLNSLQLLRVCAQLQTCCVGCPRATVQAMTRQLVGGAAGETQSGTFCAYNYAMAAWVPWAFGEPSSMSPIVPCWQCIKGYLPARPASKTYTLRASMLARAARQPQGFHRPCEHNRGRSCTCHAYEALHRHHTMVFRNTRV